MRLFSICSILLVHGVAIGLSPAIAFGQEKDEQPEELELGYEAFDQRADSGWRKVADQQGHLAAARLIDRYEREREGLAEWQRVNLRFHAGQLYAFAGRKDEALRRLKRALYSEEPAESPVQWNVYVRATIAFLERDRPQLTKLREGLASGWKLQGVVPNLDVVDRLIEHFDEPYSVAYCPKRTPSPSGVKQD